MHFGFKMAASMRQYLLCFAHEHVEFRLAELRAITSIFGIKAELNDPEYDQSNPFLLLRLPSDSCADKIMARTMLGRFMIEVWGQGNSWTDLRQSLKLYPEDKKAPYNVNADMSFCFRMRTLGKKLGMVEKLAIIEDLAEFLDFKGKVDLKNPEQVFHIYADYGLTPNKIPEQPYKVYFGRLIAEGQRQLEQLYSVKKRHFIGNTSMDATLSLLMANQAQLRPGLVTFDPFVGTGSLLVGSAHFGSYVMGGDININIIHGRGKTSRKGAAQYRGKDENIRANLRQYGLEHLYLDVLVSDFSCQVWREQPVFDAIITDPPYGIRESTRKIGSTKEPTVNEDQAAQHIPSKTNYHLSDIFTDLLNFSARFLRLHGRLVYWLPVCRPEYTEDQVPRHPCLSLVANSEQPLSTTIGRRLITMEKTRHIEDLMDDAAEAEIRDSFYQEHNAIREKVFGKHVREQKMKLMNKSEPR
ncbi:tRNA (guanine(10)-N2)-methyltransferase homolog [Patiria miniata]|uniref:tRNA (guanine(10)-N(2))-methyltransferase TRMT11 n=1 Tax=Patiria miniata TaxID=46514 RepID=A0A913ZJY7_PATMI|nr:tRNA (guanine(10)-N2)-methyltransferase homolog [Patiria miniata]